LFHFPIFSFCTVLSKETKFELGRKKYGRKK